ncbi:MAG: carboxypeptidase regulatory-like domain-containing protein, partial [Acidobacteriota bacterium]
MSSRRVPGARLWTIALLALTLGTVLTMTPTVLAQVLYGTIVGNVTDQSGAAVPGADVTVTNQETNRTLTTITNELGAYSFTTLRPGNFTVEVIMPGFKEFERTNVPVTVNNVTRVNVMLQVGEVSETVTV